MYGPAGANSLAPAEVEDQANASGYLSVGVPGLVRALCTAQGRWGRLPLAQVMEPAIHWAEQGWVCDWYTAYCIAADQKWFRRFPESGRVFLPGGYIPDQYTGAKIVQRDLAETYRLIARDGAAAFYTGEIAHAIDEDMRKNGGILTAEDLAGYDVDLYEPLSVSYRGYEVLIPRAPSGAWTIAQTLNVLERFDLAALGHNSGAHLHTFIEAARHAFADRYYYASDPDFVPSPRDGMLSKEYARELAALIDPGRAKLDAVAPEQPWTTYAYQPIHDPWPYDGGDRPAAPWQRPTPEPAGSHTTHFSIIDRDRNMVSVTQTAAELWGAKITTRGTGIMHADAMVWFNPLPGAANSIAPNKRALCNMGTMLVTKDGKPFMALGSPGGRFIINCNTQVLSNVVDFGMSMQPAISAPRVDASGRTTTYDDRIDERTVQRLQAMGHAMQPVEEAHLGFGGGFAKPTAVMVGEDGLLRGGVEAFRIAEARGY